MRRADHRRIRRADHRRIRRGRIYAQSPPPQADAPSLLFQSFHMLDGKINPVLLLTGTKLPGGVLMRAEQWRDQGKFRASGAEAREGTGFKS